MKLKLLESLLGNLQQFSNPKVELEQYPTGSHIASRMLFTAENSFGDVSDKVVADFGCGCGTLGAAAALMGAEQVIGIDIDSESLEMAASNAEDLELDINFIQCDISSLPLRGCVVDTVVMNPPFGTRKKGADMDFLRVALKIASHAVYSLHKTSTRDVSKCNNQKEKGLVFECFILLSYSIFSIYASILGRHVKRAALQNLGAKSAEVLCELRYDVPKLYKFHKKKEVDIAVDLWRFEPKH
ncbi:rRNA N6-adenosine-methyltransferase METTL5 [Linum perenne]